MPKQSFDELPPSKQAGILCRDPRFQKFVAIQSGLPNQSFCDSAAAQFLRKWCGIISRRDLATDPIAQDKYQTLLTEFDVWTGKQAAPR